LPPEPSRVPRTPAPRATVRRAAGPSPPTPRSADRSLLPSGSPRAACAPEGARTASDPPRALQSSSLLPVPAIVLLVSHYMPHEDLRGFAEPVPVAVRML